MLPYSALKRANVTPLLEVIRLALAAGGAEIAFVSSVAALPVDDGRGERSSLPSCSRQLPQCTFTTASVWRAPPRSPCLSPCSARGLGAPERGAAGREGRLRTDEGRCRTAPCGCCCLMRPHRARHPVGAVWAPTRDPSVPDTSGLRLRTFGTRAAPRRYRLTAQRALRTPLTSRHGCCWPAPRSALPCCTRRQSPGLPRTCLWIALPLMHRITWLLSGRGGEASELAGPAPPLGNQTIVVPASSDLQFHWVPVDYCARAIVALVRPAVAPIPPHDATSCIPFEPNHDGLRHCVRLSRQSFLFDSLRSMGRALT